MAALDDQKYTEKKETINKFSSSFISTSNSFTQAKEEIKTEDIISYISFILSNEIEKNKKLHKKILCGKNEVLFSRKIPKLSIEKFLVRIVKYTEIENMTLLLAFNYIQKLIEKENFILCINNVYNLLLGTAVLAIKILEDIKYDNSEYCRIGGLSLKVFNLIEYDIVNKLNFELNASKEDLEKIISQINNIYLSKNSRNFSEDTVVSNY